MQSFLPKQIFKLYMPVRYCIAVLMVFILSVNNGYGQPASVSWPLSTDGVAVPTGNVTGGNQSSNGVGANAYIVDGVSSDDWAIGVSQDAGKYYEFTVSPIANYNLLISDINIDNNTDGISGTALIQYAYDAAFTSPVTVGSSFAVSTGASATTSFNSLSINVNNGQTLYIRVFAWDIENSTKFFNAKNLIVSGNTVLCLPDVSGFTTLTPSAVCAGSPINVTFTSSSLNTDNYTLTYDLSGANVATGLTASSSFTAGAPGSGSFTIPAGALTNTGNTTVTITSVTNTNNCSSNLSSGNIVTATVTALSVATFSYAASPYCASGTNPLPTFSGGGVAGIFSSTGGLTFVNATTGEINLSASTPGIYTVTNTIAAAGGCALVTATSDITITADNTISLTSATGTDAQTLCINTAITNITYSTTGAIGATFSGLPAGVTGNWGANVATISGTPIASGTFNYTVTLTGGCGNITANGSIIVTPNNTITLTSSIGTNAQTLCINTAITNITYSTTNATGATFSGLPAGVAGTWVANVVTISGTPTASGTFNYTVTLTGSCGNITANGFINVTANNTINHTSAVGTDAQTRCINVAITNITYSTTGATGATFSGLPAGVTGTWAANVATISGTPTASGTFNYTITTTGGCITPAVTASGSIIVTANNTIVLSSSVGTNAQTICINTAITNIIYLTTGATGATFSGLPAGVTGNWAANVATISGTPTVSGTFNYTVTTTGGCTTPAVTETGSITVTANNTINRTSAAGTDAQTRCINLAITNITYSTTGATGATFSGLPAGVTGSWAANVVTISGTPTAGGTFNYTITTTGGCATPAVAASGTITVTANNTITRTSAVGTDAQTRCINVAITNITYSTTGATGATFSGLPAGVTGNWAANTVTITGSPTASGTFNYTVTTTGGCTTPAVTATGSIIVTANNTITLSSAAGTNAQTLCINNAITNVTYSTTTATGATFSGLPAGVTGNWAANTVTITGSPTASGTFNYIVTLTGGCATTTASGSITVYDYPAATGVAICQNGSGSLTSSAACAAAIPGTAGANFAGTGTTSGGFGTSWINTSRVSANDNSYTTTTDNLDNGDVSEGLIATNFGFAIPANATITGVQVTIGRFASNSNTIRDNNLQLVVGGATTGANRASATGWTSSEIAAAYGSTSDLWGTALTPAQVNASNFGVSLAVECYSGNNRSPFVDYIQITISYTTPGPLNWYTVSSGGSAIGFGSPFNPVGVSGSGLPNTATPGTTIFYAECAAAPGCRTGVNFLINPLPTITGNTTACIGLTSTLTGSGTPAAANPWVSSNTGIATINSSGVVTGVAAGTSNITYTNNNNCSITTTVTVSAPVISGILNVCIGFARTLTGNGAAAAVNPWVSSNTAIATVNSTGVVTGVAPGTTNITYTNNNGCFTTSSFTVNSLPVVSITGSTIVCAGGPNSNTTLSPAVGGTWASSNNSRATVTNAGVVTGVSAGAVTFTFTQTSTGCSNTTGSISVSARPTATFTASPGAAVCANTNVTYTTQTGGGITNYVWSVPGVSGTDYTIISGGIGAGSNTVTLQWLTTGSKTVTVNYSNSNGCTSASAASNITTVNVRPAPTFTTAPGTAVCATTNIIYTTQAGQSSYVWSVPGVLGTDYTIIAGGIGSGSNTVTLQWLTTGSKTVTINYTNASGCTALSAASNTTTVNARPIANAITGPTAVCVGSTITLTSNATGTPTLTYTFASSNGNASVTNAGVVTGVTAGTSNITYTVTDGNTCTATSPAYSITINARPTPTISLSPASPICASTNITYTTQPSMTNYIWVIPGVAGTDYTLVSGGTSTDNSVTLQWLSTGTKNVTVNYTNGSGCTAASAGTSSTTVNARPTPIFTTQPGASVCASTGVNTTDITYTTQGGQSNYIWSVPGVLGTDYTIVSGGIGTGSNTVTLRWITSGSKTVTVNYTNAGGCTAFTAASNTTTVNALPVVNTSVSSVCVNSTINATPNSAGTWVSSSNAIATITNAGLITGVAAGSVTFTYTLTATGCARTTSAVTVNPLPFVSPIANGASAICVNDITVFTDATSGGTWSITNGTGTASIDASGLVTGLSAGGVTVVYTYSNGTCTNSVSVPLTINTIPAVAAIGGGAASVCVNATTAAFTNITPGGTWSIINGTGSASINASGVATGVSAGTVTVVYTVDNGTCSNESAVLLTVNPLPSVAAIGGGALYVCVNSTTAAFTNTTPSGVWSIVNGTGTASITLGGVVTGLTAGNVTVAYTVTNGTCSNTATQSLTINPLPVIAAIGGGATSVCIGSTTPAFTDATPGGIWSINNGTGTASITVGGVVIGLTAGNVTVVYSVNNGTCTDFVTKSVTVNSLPIANAITGSNTLCAGSTINLNSNASGFGSLTYTWSSSNTSNATITNAGVVTGVSSGLSNITYTVTDGNGCSKISSNFSVNVSARPTANITSANTTICDGSPVAITGNVTANGAWTLTLSNGATATGFGNGTFNISVTPALTTVYTVTSLVDANCSSIASDLTGSTTVTVNDNVVITTQPVVSQTACSGNSVSISVSATGTGLTYQWRKGVTNLVNGGNISGATSATLVLNPVTVGDAAANYNVVVSGAVPCASVTSNNSQLIVNQAVAITTQPVSQTLCSESSVSFTVAATGSGLTYQWERNGTPLTDGGDISGATTTTLNITNLTAANAGNYTAVVSGLAPCAPVTSNTAVLTVNTAVVITTEPADTIAVCATLPVTFTVAATGSGLTYQWYKGTFPGTPVVNNANISGAATASLHFNQANVADIDDYYVIVTGLAPCVAVQSTYGYLTVDQTITITQQPTAQTICTGSDVQFVVVATAGVDPLIYQWRKNGIDIPGATDDTLNIIGATVADAGNYDVEITGIAGCVTSFSTVVSLTVNPLSVGGTVNSNTIVCGGVNSGVLTLTGNTGNVIRWEFSTDGGGTWATIANTTTSQAYTNLTVQTMYRAVVKSGLCAENNSSAATISFFPVPDATATPSSQTVCSGLPITTIALSGSVSGTTYTWTRNNTGTVTGIAASGSGNISGTLTNTNLSPITVTFTITPTANGCIGTPTTATVMVDPSPDAIATPSSQTICSGDAITTIALSSTVPSTTYTWVRDNTGTVTGIAASGSGNISGSLTNTTSAPITVTFTIIPTANTCIGSSITATVVVNPTPNAIATPSSQTICSAGTITAIALSGSVSGTTYTWTRNNTGTVTGIATSGSGNITGSLTNTTLSPVTVTFTITPSANGCPGTAITATVLVNPSPDVTATPSSQTICSANAITTIVLSSTVPSTTYTWARNNTGTVTGIAASGSGNISGSLTNTTNAPITVTFTITPTANTCPGTAITATVLVNPTPNAVATPSSQTICSGPIANIALTGNVSGTTYNWTRNNTGTVTGIAASGSSDVTGTLTNTTNALVTVTFTITPTANGCPGSSIAATVAVKPTPTVSVTNSTQTLCSGLAITSMVISNPNAVATTTFSWTRDNTVNLTGIAASGTGTPISGALTNITNAQQVTTFTVSATANGCSSSTTAVITVNPKPVMTSASTAKICYNSTVSIPLTSTVASNYTWVAANNANTTGESTTTQTTSILSNTLVNTSTVSQFTPRQNVVYTVTPTSTPAGCVGNPQTVTVTVSPRYNVSFFEYPTDDNGFTICDGDLVGGGGQNDIDLIEGEYSGATLLWQYSIGSSAGPWNAMPGPYPNNGIHDTLPPAPSIFSPIGNYYFRILVDGCPSDTLSMVKTSTLTIEAGADRTVCQTATPAAITLTGASVSGTASTTVGGTWSVFSISPVNGGANGIFSSSAFQTAANVPNVTYTPPAFYTGVITLVLTSNDPDGGGPCGPLRDTLHINVSQAPIISNSLTAAICSGANTNITLTSVIPSTYTWTVGTITGSITGASAGSGNTINQVLTNPSSATAGTVQYIVTPTPISPATCAAVTAAITVTVRPLPAVSLSRSPATICFGSASTLTATNSGGTLNGSMSGSNSVSQAISSTGTPTITSNITLPAGTITAASAITLSMNLTHSWAGDLTVTLISPSCGSSVIFNRPGGTNNNDDLSGNYTFTSSSGTTFPANTDPITAQTYNASFAGITFPCTSAAGNWILQITDNANGDGGSLNSWSLSINTSGVYTSVFSGPATIGAVSYSGTGNTTATASVTPPVGTNTYTVTTTDAFGCAKTSSSVDVTVNAPPTLTGATQQASVCAGSSAQINITGLLASSTSTVTYRINGGPTQTVTGVIANAGGNASFNSIALTAANNGQTLQITGLTTTSTIPSCSQIFTQNVILSVNATPTLTGASQQADVCAGSSAQINLTGLVPGNIITATYTINGGPVQTVTNISVSAGGNANFTTIGLTAANNGQILQITGITITSALPNCFQSFTRNVTLDVHPTPSLSSSLSPGAICSGSIFSYVPSSSIPGSSFTWSRSVVAGISQPASTGSGNINETLTNTTSAPVNVTFVVTTTANGCDNSPGENVVLTVNPAPSLSTVSQPTTVCAGTGGTINLTGLIPSSTSTIFYSINGISQPSVAGVVSNASGNASFTSANLTAVNNGQVLRITGVSTTSNSPTCAKTFSIITLLSVNAIPTLSAASQAAAVCVSGPATINITGLIANSTNNTISYTINGVAQTPVTGVNANGSGAASFITTSLTGANNGQTLTITGITNGTCSQSFTQNVTLAVGTTNTWLGVNTNWFDPSNWCAGVPTSTSDVLIPGSLSFYPLVISGVPAVRNITVQATASVTVSGAKMQIAGSITNTGTFNATTGTIELNGISGVQTISGSTFVNKTLDGLIISNTAGVNVSSTANDTLNIADSLSFGNVSNTVLNTGNNITLLSRAIKTARVADITNGGANSGNSFTGKVILERYIPQRRAWRMMTVPLQQAGSQTFNASWQEGAVNPDYVYANRINPNPGYGMLITGPTPAVGFDPSPMNNYSVQQFNPLTLGWVGVPNTLTAKVTDSTGYMVFVRGDRNTQIYLNTAAPTSTTVLRTSGFLKTNLQTVTVPPAVGAYSLVGNPYASSIDLRKVSTSGGVSGVNYVVWDPALTGGSGVGAYQYLTRSGGPGTDYLVFPGNSAAGGGSYGAAFSINNNIQSSQAFLVQNAGAGSINVNENAKIVPTSSTVFRPMAPATNPVQFGYISTLLMYENGSIDSLQLVDGALMMYRNDYSNDIDLEDAKKMNNFSSENFGVSSNGQWMQIEKRTGIQADDTIFFKAKSYRVRDYQLKIEAANIDQAGLSAFLEDKYLQTSTPVSLDGATVYRFKVTVDSGAWRPDRFRIVFKQNVVLPVTFSSVKAYLNNEYINVDWKTEHELSIANYEVEKSTDGVRFTKAYTETNVVNNDRGAAYSWVDKNPLKGFNFYRIRSKDVNGTVKYTAVVKVLFGKSTPAITLYPNPLVDGTFNLYFVNEASGEYKLRLLNSAGQLIDAVKINHAATSPTETFKPKQQLLQGNYILEITKPDGTKQAISAMY
jgi:subtilisin-like proprotein convertase family protein